MSTRPTPAGKVVRFGVFEFNVASAELRKNGLTVRLQEQPKRILRSLLDRPCELVTREQLRSELWRDGTFVEFEHGLNVAVGKIRSALGDSPSSPRFIETVPRKGYRFIAPVTEELVSIPPDSAEAPFKRVRRSWLAAAVTSCLAIALVVAWLLFAGRIKPPDPVATPLTSLPGGEFAPSFSPSGERVAFTYTGPAFENYDIYVKEVGSERLLRLTHHPAVDASPAWSPNGKWIAFGRALSGDNWELYIVPAVGGREERIAEFRSHAAKVSWGRDSRWLVFPDHGPTGGSSGLHRVSVETGERRRLTSTEDMTADLGPAVSPDGRNLAFVRREGYAQHLFILRLNEAGDPASAPRRMLPNESWVDYPEWTAGGQALIVELGQTSAYLARIRLDADRPERLTFLGENVRLPAISAASRRLAFVRIHSDSNIWKQTIGDGAPKAAVEWPCSSTYSDRQPRYSSDGLQVAFISNRSGRDAIWRCDSLGANPTFVGDLGDARGTLNWALDGRSLILLDPARSYSVDIVTGTRKGLSVPGFVSRDGKWLFFTSSQSGRSEIWKSAMEGGQPTQLTQNGGVLANDYVDGQFLYYVKPIDGGAQKSEPTMPSAQVSLWRVPISGGAEEKLVDALSAPINFAVAEDGVYFIPAAGPNYRSAIRFLRFSDRKVQTVRQIDRPLNWGLSISPDRRSLLFTQHDNPNADLVLVENFH